MAYILALAIGLGSLALYTAAFFFPEVYRKGDFFWSGVGMFYALILWFCAGGITGAVLLGQLAAVMIVLWFGWQNLMLRRSLTPVAEQTQVKEDLKEQLAGGLSGLPQLVKTGLKKGEQSSVAAPTTPDATGEQPESPMEVAQLSQGSAPDMTDSGETEVAQPSQGSAPDVTDESRDPNASAEAPRKKEEKPVKAGKQKQRKFLGLGKILGSVTSRSRKPPKSQPDQKITSSDSPDDESEWDSPAETRVATANEPVPDVTTSQTNAERKIETSAVETSEPVRAPEQATSPGTEETIATSAVQTKEAVTELEQATLLEPVTEPDRATSPGTEETLTGAEVAQKEETSEGENTSESSSQSAEIKVKTDDV